MSCSWNILHLRRPPSPLHPSSLRPCLLCSVYQGLYCALENGGTSKLGKSPYDSRASFLARKQNKLGCSICKMSCYGRHCVGAQKGRLAKGRGVELLNRVWLCKYHLESVDDNWANTKGVKKKDVFCLWKEQPMPGRCYGLSRLPGVEP